MLECSFSYQILIVLTFQDRTFVIKVSLVEISLKLVLLNFKDFRNGNLFHGKTFKTKNQISRHSISSFIGFNNKNLKSSRRVPGYQVYFLK